MTIQPFQVEYTCADGTTHATEVHAATATDAVVIMSARSPLRLSAAGIAPAWSLATARLKVSPGGIHRAAYAVARDQVQGEDQGWMFVRDAVDHARNSLRLPEEPYCVGAYPLDDDGSELATAYRIILEATDEEIAASVSREGSVRA